MKMNKVFALALLLMLPCFLAYGADTKVTALTANTDPQVGDLLYMVDDPGGTPLSQKITLANVAANMPDIIVLGSNLSVGAAGVKLTGDGDGALTLLGLGNGSDEDLSINLDDTANTVVVASTTAVDLITLTGIGLNTTLATDASSLSTGSIYTAGGLAVTKQLYVGDDIDMSVSGTGVYDITLKDNVADGLSIVRGTTDMMVFDTTTAAPLITITPATTITGTLTETGAIVANGNVTLGNAVTDITTLTGKVAGATPVSFDGNTADTVYTILAVDDPASSSKTVTLPAVTGTVMLTGAATAITAGTTPALTITKGNQLYTDTITTDNQDQTITFSAGGAAGDKITIIFITDTGGSGDEVITFHTTLTNTEGTLTLANLTAGRYTITFVSNGAVWNEESRTAALS